MNAARTGEAESANLQNSAVVNSAVPRAQFVCACARLGTGEPLALLAQFAPRPPPPRPAPALARARAVCVACVMRPRVTWMEETMGQRPTNERTNKRTNKRTNERTNERTCGAKRTRTHGAHVRVSQAGQSQPVFVGGSQASGAGGGHAVSQSLNQSVSQSVSVGHCQSLLMTLTHRSPCAQ